MTEHGRGCRRDRQNNARLNRFGGVPEMGGGLVRILRLKFRVTFKSTRRGQLQFTAFGLARQARPLTVSRAFDLSGFVARNLSGSHIALGG